MGKNIDYAKVKALASSILECIGDDSEGENPRLGKQIDNDAKATEFGASEPSDGGQENVVNFLGGELSDGKDESESSADSDDTKKKKKDASLAMMGSVLASRLAK